MPKVVKELSALEVRRIVEPGTHSVGGVPGLLLQITGKGGRSWLLRARVAGRRREFGLGSFPTVSLANARAKASELREKLAEGIDPVAERQAARAALLAGERKRITFDQCAAEVVKVKQAEARNKKHAAQWENTLATYASPVLGALSVSEVELAHIVEVLRPIWETKTETATRVRQRIEAVLSWATTHGYREGPNPAEWRGNLDTVLPKPAKVKISGNHAALPIPKMGVFMRDLRQRDALAARGLEFAILTAARSGEVRGATWSEIDLDATVWTIPAERMKAGKPHRVPLSDDALAILRGLPAGEPGELVFNSSHGRQLSENAFTALLKRMGVEATAHGFRSTFRDWVAEFTATPHDVAEMALAHTIKNSAEAAYRRGDLLEKRRRLMKQWAEFCRIVPKEGEKVTPIRRHNP
ncbi:integrase arm-type DNA-binding domain-containing protein [Halomonas sp. ANAO-440]|uniref:tyrosine-type recombinase/integrase n=1 Tax=Halomonas sp. ANAO-440 TaxID=2861360 RepID=UPI001CAA516C|nr:site-specific integrase [Halomonas sp. ANAO-440]MBZ0330426.1 integrase arm-type DNA-binding domain-containing protein [Halomonas sp. ANAO-440]